MKKLIALLLALTLVTGLVACGETTAPETTGESIENNGEPVTPDEGDIDIPLTTESDEIDIPLSTEEAPATNGAVDLINSIWDAVPEDKRFFAMGGDMNHIADNAAGVYDLADEGLTSTLLIPADQIANVDEAASLVHAMNLNNFTCGAFHVTGDTAAFAEAMYNAISSNQWICGMPEKLLIAIVDEYVIACFGINDAVAPFETAFGTVYATAEVKYNEAISG